MFLINDQRRRQVFDWFCAGALAIIVPAEIIVRLVPGHFGHKVFTLFILNPIPLGTLIILLSPGPMSLLFRRYPGIRSIGWLLVLLSGVLIFLTYKRGTWLALAGMLLVWMLYRGHRLRYLAVSVLLAAALTLSLLGPAPACPP